jgi:hypothetical protein
MGVFKAVTMYRTDTGKELAVEEMTTTHLMNAINHHKKQCDMIIKLKWKRSSNGKSTGFLPQREADLKETIAVLEEELSERNPDDEREGGQRAYGRRFEPGYEWLD